MYHINQLYYIDRWRFFKNKRKSCRRPQAFIEKLLQCYVPAGGDESAFPDDSHAEMVLQCVSDNYIKKLRLLSCSEFKLIGNRHRFCQPRMTEGTSK